MDTYSAADIARDLHTSTPRVIRAAKRLGIDAEPNGRLALTRGPIERLVAELGCTPSIAGLSAIEVKVLAALSRAPFGLSSARVVAAQAGVSPTAASKALKTLEQKNLVRREATVIAAGRARTVELLTRTAERSAGWRSPPHWLGYCPPSAIARPSRECHIGWSTCFGIRRRPSSISVAADPTSPVACSARWISTGSPGEPGTYAQPTGSKPPEHVDWTSLYEPSPTTSPITRTTWTPRSSSSMPTRDDLNTFWRSRRPWAVCAWPG